MRVFCCLTYPKAIGELLRAIDSYTGGFVTQCALKLSPLVMLRPGEVRQAEWAEIKLAAADSKDERPMSENTVLGAIRRMGYTTDDMTAHGFRSMASTRLNESHLFHPDAIERQLAHGERDRVRAAYNRAEHLPERRKMMQWWADYLDGLKKGADVIPMRSKSKAS